MVAAAELPSKKLLSVKRAKFAALVAEGATQQAAYRLIFSPHCKKSTAEVEGSRIANEPEVLAEIARIRNASWSQRVLVMQERRGLLGDIARKGVKAKPTAGDAIAAIREDAILCGERRTDGTQVNIGGDLNLSLVLQSLRNGATTPALTVTQEAEVLPVLAGAVHSVAPESRDSRSDDGASRRTLSAPASAILGPLGRIRRAAAVNVAPAPIAPSNAPAMVFEAED